MITPEIVITSINLLFFFLLFVVASLRLRSGNTVVIHLAIYIGFGLLAGLMLVLVVLDSIPLLGIPYTILTGLFLLAMILAFGALSLSFLEKRQKALVTYWSVAAVILIIWAVFAFNIGGFQTSAKEQSGLMLTQLISGLGWAIPIVVSLAALWTAFRKKQLSKYLNRLRYWLIATMLLAASGLVLFINPTIYYWAGTLLTLTASILASYVVLSYHTADLNRLVGRALHYIGVTGAIAALYYFCIAVTIIVSRSGTTPINTFFWSIVLSVLLAVVTPPLWKFASRLFSVVIFGKAHRDDKKIIRHYSRRISTALDMKRLADIVIDLMIETLGIDQGIVFVNERGSQSGISLRPLSSVGVGDLNAGMFSPDSPFIDYFRQNEKYLYQYDIDVLPDFQSLNSTERIWLSNLGMEIYVPILRHREFVGLLAFGPRSQGTSYYEEDIDLMIALADQSALAMDSARLFEQLATINQEAGVISEQLAGLDQNKRDFLSIASHELRTPLTHIHGYSRMLLDITDEEAQDTAYVKTIVEGIAKGSERMKSVIDMMFDVTEANVGEMSLFLGPVDLSEVINQAARPYLPAFDERRIAFGKEEFEDLPVIEADGTRLVQAFENLIGNAIKYTPDGGMVKVSGEAVVVDNIGSAVQIVVSDTGIGIDPENHEKVFEKFFRADDTDHHSTGKTKYKGAGPGLGLTLVKGIAKAHGGRVWVESLGHDEVNFPGSKFFFVIPLHPVSKSNDEDTPKQSQIETVHWRSKDLKPDNTP